MVTLIFFIKITKYCQFRKRHLLIFSDFYLGTRMPYNSFSLHKFYELSMKSENKLFEINTRHKNSSSLQFVLITIILRLKTYLLLQ